MTYDRDAVLYWENESYCYRLNADGSHTPLYSVGFRMLDYIDMRVGYLVNIEKVDPRAMPAVEWLEERGHLNDVHSCRGRHIVVNLERDDFLLFKLTFSSL